MACNKTKNFPIILLYSHSDDRQVKIIRKMGELFKNSKDILDEHKNAVVGGQSNVQNDTDSHFVAFIVKNNELYELDGMTPAPISHGNCSKEDLLPRSANVIKEYMARDPDNLGFSMIVLAATSQ